MNAASATPMVELLGRARAGDPAARSALLAASRDFLGPEARATLESWLAAKVDASDLLQQTMLDVHRGLAAFRGQTEAEWHAWLKQVLSNNAAGYVRHFRGTQKRQQRLEVAIAAPRDAGDTMQPRAAAEPCDGGPSPSAVVSDRERQSRLVAAIGQLPEDYREVIRWRHLERLPFDDVARRMNRTRPAVQMLWMRALRKLQEMVDE